jgi:hypothetical protein
MRTLNACDAGLTRPRALNASCSCLLVFRLELARLHCSSRIRDWICKWRRSELHCAVRVAKTREGQYEKNGRPIMKTILATIIALSVLTGVAASASASDPQRGAYSGFSTGQGN